MKLGEKLARRARFGLVDAPESHALYLEDGYWIHVGSDVDSGELACFAWRAAALRRGEPPDESAIRAQVEQHALTYFPPENVTQTRSKRALGLVREKIA